MSNKIYISGKITGLPIEEAQRLFEEAEQYIKNEGYKPVNPMKEVPYYKDWDWKDYMIEDLKLLFECNSIFMLSNWGASKGARIERAIAIEHGMNVLYQ